MMQSDEVPIQRSKWSKAMLQFYDRCRIGAIGDTSNNEVTNSAMQLIYNTIRAESNKNLNGMQSNLATNNMGMFAPARPTSASVNNFFASFNSNDVHKESSVHNSHGALAAPANAGTIKPAGSPVFVPQTTMEGLNSEVAKLFAWVAEIDKKVDQLAAGKVGKIDREKLLALRLQPSAKLRPEYLPKVEMGGRG